MILYPRKNSTRAHVRNRKGARIYFDPSGLKECIPCNLIHKPTSDRAIQLYFDSTAGNSNLTHRYSAGTVASKACTFLVRNSQYE